MHENSTPATSVHLVLSSEVRLIDLVHTASEKMAELAGFDADEALNVGLAVREAAINAIVHGNGEDPQREVDIVLEAGQAGLQAVITDQGDGFDPDSTPDPTEGAGLLATSGRGLLLIRAFVDEVEFRPAANGGTQVILSKYGPTAGNSNDQEA